MLLLIGSAAIVFWIDPMLGVLAVLGLLAKVVIDIYGSWSVFGQFEEVQRQRGVTQYGRPGVDDGVIDAAIAELGLTEWVNGLSDGLDTPVGERGSQLSAGERQLVALIRAWLVQPDLLVLDEATSAVAPALEVQLRRAIDRLIAGRTSITVAHRLSTAEASDEVLVFDAGRLVERGTHDELLVAGGVYAGLHEDWTTGTRVWWRVAQSVSGGLREPERPGNWATDH